jgi:hypothetical protein
MNRSKGLRSGFGLLQVAMALLAAAGAAPWDGHAAEATLRVSAVVPRHTSIRLAPPSSLTISEADVARGYVEVTAPVQVAIQSNVQQGYTLVFQNESEQVRQAVVQGLAAALVVGSGGVSASRPAAGGGMWRETLQLRVRFDLSPQARPGVHAWPLQVSMMSL